MKRTSGIVMAAALLSMGAFGWADVYSLTPSDSDLGDLDHASYYTWGIETPWPANEQIVGASLVFTQIRNWTVEENVLYVHLLNYAKIGVRVKQDSHGGQGDQFDGQGIVLTVYRNLPATPQDLVYDLSGDELETLRDYASDGRFGVGIDPDCHFYNDGVILMVQTGALPPPPVPEPATMALLAVGVLGVITRRPRGH